MTQVAKDFGISESCVGLWVRMANFDEGACPGPNTVESVELRGLKCCNRVLEQKLRSCHEQRPPAQRRRSP